MDKGGAGNKSTLFFIFLNLLKYILFHVISALHDQ